MKRGRSSGFTLIELLVAAAIIGIIAAIAIMAYQKALVRSRQKRTMADMRSIAVAWESRAIDTKRYNAAGAAFTVPASSLTYEELNSVLVPTYIRILPRTDGWNNALRFNSDQPLAGAEPADEYCIRSAGRDAVFQSTYVPGMTTDDDADIVYSAGNFVVYPKSGQ